MSATTQCPTCDTRFKISQSQLEVHQGWVRCGRCQAVFDAKQTLQDDQPSPQLELLIQPDVIRQEPTEFALEPSAKPIEASPESLELNLAAPAAVESQEIVPQLAETNTATQQLADKPDNIEAAKPITLATKVNFVDISGEHAPPPAKKGSWLWLAGCLLLLMVLLVQAAFFFRVELSANQPGLKPFLISFCHLLRCTVPLPQKADLMSIESSDLEADPAQSGVIALNALLRNHAAYAQAFPYLELTLTDAQDKPLGRRTFHPAEYLKPGEVETSGLAANRELSVKLNLDTTDLKPAGYRLFLFYPQ
jgi:predicted Zn finger-like uncharacterized protein